MTRNRPWSREELILALDLYLKIGASYKTHPDVIELSVVLNRVSDLTRESDATRFRNPNGVAMKLGNFARLDGDYSGTGLSHGNKMESGVWDEFSSNRGHLVSVVGEIGQRLQDIVKDTPAIIDSPGSPEAIERKFYALNANPDTYRIQDAIAGLAFDSWLVGNSWLKTGGRVIIWKSYGRRRPARRGIVGFGEVIDAPTIRAAPNEYWTDPASGEIAAPRITVKYVGLSNLPLWEDELPELAKLTVSGGQGTVFRVSAEQFDSAVHLAGGWPEHAEVADGIIVVQAVSQGHGQGFSVCQTCKKAVELRAMELATKHYGDDGYTVTDVSTKEPYDLIP